MREKRCLKCRKKTLMYGRQLYCGSTTLKTGCAWLMKKNRYGKERVWKPYEGKATFSARVKRLRKWREQYTPERFQELIKASARK